LADAILRCATDPGARARVSTGVQAMGQAGAARHLDALERVFDAVVHQRPGDPAP
jgi:DTW domain-containing protein YfiP